MTPEVVKQIDFLPEKFRHVTRRRRTSYWRFAVVVLFAGVFAAAAWGMYSTQRQVRREYEQVTTLYIAAQAQELALASREGQLAKLRSYADLETFLRHPWPRSQILEQLFAPLPANVIVDKLHLSNVPKPIVAAVETPGEAGGEVTKTAATDLEEIRKTLEANEVVIHLQGTALDQAGLHAYLHRLTSGKLFRSAEVESIEAARAADAAGAAVPSGASKFTARIVVRSGWGLPDGPKPEELSVDQASPPTEAASADAGGAQ